MQGKENGKNSGRPRLNTSSGPRSGDYPIISIVNQLLGMVGENPSP